MLLRDNCTSIVFISFITQRESQPTSNYYGHQEGNEIMKNSPREHRALNLSDVQYKLKAKEALSLK